MPSFFFHVRIDLADISRAPSQWALPLTPAAETQIGTKGNLISTSLLWQHESARPKVPVDDTASGAASATSSPRPSGIDDWRLDEINMQSITMPPSSPPPPAGRGPSAPAAAATKDALNNGLAAPAASGPATKARFEPLNEVELGWGIVRLYRDSAETPGLYDEPPAPPKAASHKHGGRGGAGGGKPAHAGRSTAAGAGTRSPSSGVNGDDSGDGAPPFRDEDCTTLGILAVPSYMTPADFLGFVGEKTREEVQHFRMLRTARSNRYMVLLRFRDGRRARLWRRAWNGRVFNDMEPEHCHVVFVKSVEFRELRPAAAASGDDVSFPDMRHDPFTPSKTASTSASASAAAPATSLRTKPAAPPTPALVELPTCPVCLERMDESTGLLTILCQHVFHCTCLQAWRGSGCPVCRYTQDPRATTAGSLTQAAEDAASPLNACRVCGADANLWVCLLCGHVGCGRYDAAHAFAHQAATAHRFAMDLATQRVWDYTADGYVHRLLQSVPDGKLVELPHANPPSAAATAQAGAQGGGGDARTADNHHDDDAVPRAKVDAMAQEYAALLTSQLDSQRRYFEQQLALASDKAAAAAASAASAAESATEAQEQLGAVQAQHAELRDAAIPALEKERDRGARRAARFEEMARKLEREWREEKSVNTGLLERIKHLEGQVQELAQAKAELAEENRDLKFFVSGGAKLQALGLGEEVVEGSVSVPEAPEEGGKGGRRKGKGKGKAKEGGG